MSERHKRKNAREMLSKAGYKSGGHFGNKMIGEEVRKGVGEHEENMHPGKKHTKLKLKDGGSVQSAAFGARVHKPRGMHKGKKSHTTVNVVVGAGKQPGPIPVPVGGPSMGAPPPPGGMPGMPPQGPMPGANRGGRFCDGGSVKGKDSQRDSIKSTSGKVEGKLKRGGKAKKLDFGGPVGAGNGFAMPNTSMMARPGNTVMGVNPGGGALPPAGSVMQASPGGQANPMPWTGDQGLPSHPNFPGRGCGNMKRGGKTKTADPEMQGGAGGGLGRLEKAEAYGAKVKKGGKVKH